MKKFTWKESLPHLVALALFLLLPIIYFSPVLEDKQLNQHDSLTYAGMSKEIVDYNKKGDDLALWTNSMFGGMPSYLIALPTHTAITAIYTVTNLFNWRPVNFVFLYLIGFYLALLLFGVNPWLALVGAISFGFGSYNFIILAAGHASKAIAIGYMAPMIGAFYYALHRKVWLGSALFGLALALEIYSNHPQITYYTFLILLVMGLAELVAHYQRGQLMPFLRRLGIVSAFALLAVAANAGRLWTTWEYGQYSMRGKSELTHDQANKTSGLDRDYATGWSYGIDETLTLLIPNFKGGSSAVGFSEDSESGKILKSNNVPNAASVVKQLPGYWGTQPGTSGPVYLGAVVCFLFVLGLFLIKGPLRTWIVVVTVLSIVLAWGHNLMSVTNLFLDYFPGYNKFRTVTMILVIAGFTFPLLAILTVQKILNQEIEKQQWLKGLKWSVAITAGLSLLFALIPSLAGSFTSSVDSQLPDWLQSAVIADRQGLLQTDALRSAIFILLGAAILWAFTAKKIKMPVMLLLLGALILIDMWGVDKRYLNDSLFVTNREARNPYPITQADQLIKQDKSLDYRVLNMAVSTFNDAGTSYYHRSIGGYHGAKMRRYQELIDFYIGDEMNQLAQRLPKIKSEAGIDSLFMGLTTLNMLNTKYLIWNPQAAPIENKRAMGSAWIVEKYRIVENADREMAALKSLDPAHEMVCDQKFQPLLAGANLSHDPASRITLTAYSPNQMTYHFKGEGNELALFSAIYYPKGWKAMIQGKEVPYFQADYIFRAMVLPKGDYDIVFRFEPTSYFVGERIAVWSSVILVLLIGGLLLNSLFPFIRRGDSTIE